MADMLLCLKGWHVPLCNAEARALLPDYNFENISSRIVVTNSDIPAAELTSAVFCSSGIQFALKSPIICQPNESLENIADKLNQCFEENHITGSIAIRPHKVGNKIAEFSSSAMTRQLGSIAVDHGLAIDLDNPQHELILITDGSENLLIIGLLASEMNIKTGINERNATKRPFFKPISLDPKLARLCINLACGQISEKAVLDPMCGTGGFAIEAIGMGRNCVALDMQEQMTTGTKENIKFLFDGTNCDYEIITGDATKLSEFVPEKWLQNIAGIVLDPPYGRNSHGTDNHEKLIDQTLSSIKEIVDENAKLVLILPVIPNENTTENAIELLHGDWGEFKQMMQTSGWSVENYYKEHVHSSLSRLIVLATVAPLN